MKPYLLQAGNTLHFQWNLHCSVGKGGANSIIEDIAYLQWYYAMSMVTFFSGGELWRV